MSDKSTIIHCPIKGPIVFDACPSEEVIPLVEHLSLNQPVVDVTRFPRGTVLPDGRLDLCKQSLGADGCSQVTKSLHNNTFVKSLLLGTDGIGDQGASAVADLVANNDTLEIVYLGCNYITATGVEEIASALVDNESVTGLWLKRNPVGEAGAAAIARLIRSNKRIKLLDLVNTNIGKRGLRNLIDALAEPDCQVRQVYFGGNQFDADDAQAIADLLRSNLSLRSLSMGVNEIGDDGALAIASALEKNQTLEELGLASNRISIRGVKELAQVIANHASIDNLDLGYLPSTKVLGAQANSLGDTGGIAIASMLQRNRHIWRLDLVNTEIGEAGRTALAAEIIDHPTITKFAIDGKFPDVSQRLLQNQASVPDNRLSQDVAMIRSVYRTVKK